MPTTNSITLTKATLMSQSGVNHAAKHAALRKAATATAAATAAAATAAAATAAADDGRCIPLLVPNVVRKRKCRSYQEETGLSTVAIVFDSSLPTGAAVGFNLPGHTRCVLEAATA